MKENGGVSQYRSKQPSIFEMVEVDSESGKVLGVIKSGRCYWSYGNAAKNICQVMTKIKDEGSKEENDDKLLKV